MIEWVGGWVGGPVWEFSCKDIAVFYLIVN